MPAPGRTGRPRASTSSWSRTAGARPRSAAACAGPRPGPCRRSRSTLPVVPKKTPKYFVRTSPFPKIHVDLKWKSEDFFLETSNPQPPSLLRPLPHGHTLSSSSSITSTPDPFLMLPAMKHCEIFAQYFQNYNKKLTCPTILMSNGSEMSYWRTSPCNQLETYRNWGRDGIRRMEFWYTVSSSILTRPSWEIVWNREKKVTVSK